MSFRVTCWMFTILQLISFFLLIFTFQHGISFRSCLSFIRVQSLCDFILCFLIWLSLTIVHSVIGPSVFRVLHFSYPVVEPGPVIWASFILTCKNSRLFYQCSIKWPFGYLVRWFSYIWIIILLKPIYIIKVVWHFFSLSGVACWFLNLADKHGITLIPGYIPTHLNV